MTNIALIQGAMEAKGLTRAQLAKLSGVNAGLIGRYLTGEIAVGMRNAPKLATPLGLTVAEVLLGRDEEAKTDEAA
jgi:transcriptional regulator with XRE-family HTH domain